MKFFIVDSLKEEDARLRDFLNKQKSEPTIININLVDYVSLNCFSFVNITILVLKSLFIGLFSLNVIRKELGLGNKYYLFSGLKATIKNILRAYKSTLVINKILNESGKSILSLQTNDLTCATVALFIANKYKGYEFIYDSHEFQIGRNRRNGWLRILIEFGLEKQIINTASQVITVNKIISKKMQLLYRNNCKFIIKYNDIYDCEFITSTVGNSFSILFIGGALNNRFLKNLSDSKIAKNISKYLFYIGKPNAELNNLRNWQIGDQDYICKLKQICLNERPLMWCALENTCVSYKFSTPNKFFQAISAGMPIIASRDSYLSQICTEFNLGPVFDGEDFGDLFTRIDQKNYETWVNNVVKFYANIKNGTISI